MDFKLEIKSESNPEEDTKMFLDEETAVRECLKRNRIIAYY